MLQGMANIEKKERSHGNKRFDWGGNGIRQETTS